MNVFPIALTVILSLIVGFVIGLVDAEPASHFYPKVHLLVLR